MYIEHKLFARFSWYYFYPHKNSLRKILLSLFNWWANQGTEKLCLARCHIQNKLFLNSILFQPYCEPLKYLHWVLILYPQYLLKVNEERSYLRKVPVSSAKPHSLSIKLQNSLCFLSTCHVPRTVLSAGTTASKERWSPPSQSFLSRAMKGRVCGYYYGLCRKTSSVQIAAASIVALWSWAICFLSLSFLSYKIKNNKNRPNIQRCCEDPM